MLHLTNLAEVADELWLQQPHPEEGRGGGGGRRRAGRRLGLFTGIGESGGLLTDEEWGIFRSAFSNLQGGWCCAPRGPSRTPPDFIYCARRLIQMAGAPLAG